jgi:hypothetical protein
LVVAAVVLSSLAAFIGLPKLFGSRLPLGEFDAFVVVYLLAFILLVSLSVKVISFLSLSFDAKAYIAVVTVALQFLIWDSASHVLGAPRLVLDFETEIITLGVASATNEFNSLALWICLISTVALYSLGRQWIDKP